MVDRPIIFSAPMVRALLAGTKTQTRRILRNVPAQPSDGNIVHDPKHEHAYFDAYCGAKKTAANPRGMTENWCWWTRDDRCGHGCKVRFVPGDRLYVREHWATCRAWDEVRPRDMPSVTVPYMTLADESWHKCDGAARGKHRQGMHMPRWASRLTLTVTDVRVERVQDISEADALAEGIYGWAHEELGELFSFEHAGDIATGCRTSRIARPAGWERASIAYANLWDGLHTKEGDGWADNPWCYALTFRVERGNIDTSPTTDVDQVAK